MMSATPSLKTVFGFINRNKGSFPVPLITVVTVEGSDDVIAIYPSGDEVKMIDEALGRPLTKGEISLRGSFFPASSSEQSTNPLELTSFGFANNHITVGTAQQILKSLELAITCDQYSGEDLQTLEEAQASYSDFVNGLKLTL